MAMKSCDREMGIKDSADSQSNSNNIGTAFSIEEGSAAKENGHDDYPIKTAHRIDHDPWFQLGLLLAVSFNCGYILGFSNLIMKPLGWVMGPLFLAVLAIISVYANWLLAKLHIIDGRRFIRYRDLMGYVFGKEMYYVTWILQFVSFILGNMGFLLLSGRALKEIYLQYSKSSTMTLQEFIIISGGVYFAFACMVPHLSAMRIWCGISTFLTLIYIVILMKISISDGMSNSKDYKLQGTKQQKIFNGFSAIAAIIFASNTGMVPELQASLKKPAIKNMHKALYFQFSAGLSVYYTVTIIGFWAYGSSVSEYLLEELSGPKWAKVLANIAVYLQIIISQHNPPYLCRKDGIFLRCPNVKESPSLWENPYSATTSWKPCAERHEKSSAYLQSENETNGYILIHAEGGLNQQRIAICNAVAVAKILNATLILPLLKQDQIWKDQTNFEDVFDVRHFIEYLKYDVPIVKDIPAWFPEKEELFTSIRRTVKNIPKYASAEFYIDNVLPRIKEKKIMALKPFVDRLGYDNVPPEINRLRCRVNYHALRFLPEIETMSDFLASRMRNRTGILHPYMALHLRFEKGMVGLSFCDFVGTRSEKATMAAYRQKEWPRRYKNGSHLWQMALEKRKEGRCPLEPGEVAVLLRAMGYPKETQIYVASGQVYGGQNRMAPLRNMFPNLVTKEELTTKEELKPFRKHITSLAALDFLVCLKSDVFVMTHGGNFAKLIIGARRYMGHRLKSIKPNKALMARSLGDPFLGWGAFIEDIVISHDTRTGLPEATFPGYDIWENPLSHCMCRA